jgi:hypothetical protein
VFESTDGYKLLLAERWLALVIVSGIASSGYFLKSFSFLSAIDFDFS